MRKITMPAGLALSLSAMKQQEQPMTNNDPYAEARRVLAYHATALELSLALRNLLSHVERLTAPVTGDRAERIAYLNEAIEAALPISPEDAYELRRVHALLEADARREAALAEAIAEIQALKQRREPTRDHQVWNSALEDAVAILAKVSAEAQP